MPQLKRRHRTGALAVGALLGALALAVVPDTANAAGWGNISSRSVNKSLSSTAWTTLHPGFSTLANVSYRYCLTVKGNGTANLQPNAFGTAVTVNSSSYVTRCTKSYSGAANRFVPIATRISGGSVTVGTITIQRYFSGSVPV